jgi:hypothetical protein
MKASLSTQFLCCTAFTLPILGSAPSLASDPVAAATYSLEIRFIDSATGAAIQPESITSQLHQLGAAERRLGPGQVGKDGRGTMALELGRHTITAATPGYRPVWGDFEMSESSPHQVTFVLDPVEQPQELRSEYMEPLRRNGLMLVAGFVVDDESGALLEGVRVRAGPSGLETETDGRGFFQFYVPAQSVAERESTVASLVFEKPGYQSEQRLYVELRSRGQVTHRIRLLPGQGTQTIDERERRRLGPESESVITAPAAAPAAPPALGEWVQPLDSPSPQATAVTNAAVRVPWNIRVRDVNCNVLYMSLLTYVKHSLRHEWAVWFQDYDGGTNSYNAGAIAVKCYAIYHINHPMSASFDICASTGNSICPCSRQAFYFDSTDPGMDAAVDYTSNWVVVASSGAIPETYYSSENNDSDGDMCHDGYCGSSRYSSPCIYDPVCAGTPRGRSHGAGMCQYGTYRWATGWMWWRNNYNYPKQDWMWLVRHYYPYYTLVNCAPLVPGDTVKVVWSAAIGVHACPGGTITNGGATCQMLTTKAPGTTGTIIDGPTTVTSDGYGYTWFKIQWSDTNGWTIENALERVFTVPAAPTNLTATVFWTNQINLSWQDATGGQPCTCGLERAGTTSGPWVQLTTMTASATNSYSDRNVCKGNTWYYRVRAYNAAGSSDYSTVAIATITNSPPVFTPLPIIPPVTAGTTLRVTNSATAPDVVQPITDFQPFVNQAYKSDTAMFLHPLASPATSTNLGVPTTATDMRYTPDVAAVTIDCPTLNHGTGCVLQVSCQFINTNNPWLLLTTANAPALPNPVINVTGKLRFDMYSDQAVRVAVGCRKTTNAVGTVLGSNGGTAGDIVWAGVTNMAGSAPMPTRTLAATNWTTFTFDFTNEPIRSYPSGGAAVLSTASGLAVLEHLAIVPFAGTTFYNTTGGTNVYNIYLDNFQALVPRKLTWSLDPRSPDGATIDSNGVVTWTPTAAQAGGSYKYYTILPVVADDSFPVPLKATNAFVVKVVLASIDLTTPTNNAVFAAPATLDLTATVLTNGNTISYVSFYNGGTLLSNITAPPYACSWTVAAPGAYPLWAQAVYAGGSTTNSATNTIFVINSLPSTTTLTGSGSPTSYGATVTFTATVTGSNPTGPVQFQDGGVNLGSPVALSGGQAQLSINDLSVPGSPHSITAVYSGNITNRSSTSSAVSQTINPIPSYTLLTTSLNPSTAGSSVTFGATVKSTVGTPAGNVVFLANQTAFSTNALVDGAAEASTTSLPLGTNTVTASYATQDNYVGSSKNRSQVVIACSLTNTIVGIVGNPDGSFTLTFQGTPGVGYYLVATPDVGADMNNWTTVPGSAITAPSPGGQWSIVVTNAGPQYYRSITITPCVP